MKKLIVSIALVGLVLLTTVFIYMSHRSHNDSSTDVKGASTTVKTIDTAAHSTIDPASIWVIVNKTHPLQPQDYAPIDLTSVGNGQVMRAAAAAALQAMFAGAKNSGYTLTADSAYRSYATQVAAYSSEVKAYGKTVADDESARPGYSEHQTGWAVDIGSGSCHVQDCFGDLAAGKWAQANAYKYGFILRYTAADKAVTGYRAEAWHFRYIGTELSTYMHEHDITTLEAMFKVNGGDYPD